MSSKILKCLICSSDKRERTTTREVIENLIKVKKEEFKGILKCFETSEIGENFYEHDFIIISEELLENLEPSKIRSQILFVLFKGHLKSKTIRNAMRSGAYGLFPVDRFYGDKLEYTEIGKFEETLKRVFREKLSNLKLECEIYKNIDWKVKLEEDSQISTRFISLFSDEAMRKVLRDINIICQRIKPFVEKLSEFWKNNKDLIEEIKDLEFKSILNDQFDIDKVKEIFQRLKEETEKKKKETEKKKTENLGFEKVESILITGPTGAGKTLIANYIYSKFSQDYFNGEELTRISMANISSALVDSELFGSFPGAFTDAKFKVGKIVASAGKMVFLDEIGEIDDRVQSKLLTYMDNLSVMPEGLSDTSLIKVPVLIIAATNKDLKKLSIEGNFRLDLFNRFKYKITVPPLKERINDLPYMISFLLQVNANNSHVRKISIKAIEKLKKYDYPGNFRELESIISYAVANAELDGRDCILEKDIQT